MVEPGANLKWVDINMTELDLTKLISHFSQSNRAEGKSTKTVAWYTEMLFDFIKFLRSNGMPAVLAALNATTVRQFVISEQGRGLSPYTVQGKVRALKAFSSWLFAEGYTPHNLLTNVKLPKVPTKLIEPLSAGEIDSLISAQNPLTSLGSVYPQRCPRMTKTLKRGIRGISRSKPPSVHYVMSLVCPTIAHYLQSTVHKHE